MFLPLIALAGLALAGHSSTPNTQQLLDESMSFMDAFYDPAAGYLYDLDREAALRHNTRSSAWYALGLLSRGDVCEADRIIRNVISGQFTDPALQWYGTYQKYPEEPEVGSEAYPAKIYSSWDPNWRGFVGTTFIVMLEEYANLLEEETKELMMASLHHAAVGDTYRVGGVDNDNLYPAYSTPVRAKPPISIYPPPVLKPGKEKRKTNEKVGNNARLRLRLARPPHLRQEHDRRRRVLRLGDHRAFQPHGHALRVQQRHLHGRLALRPRPLEHVPARGRLGHGADGAGDAPRDVGGCCRAVAPWYAEYGGAVGSCLWV